MKKRDLSVIVVVDLEATCDVKMKPEKSEIIEFGLAVVRLSSKIGGDRIDRGERLLVRPHGPITTYCTDLTGITQDEVNAAPYLSEALERIITSLPADLPPLKLMTWASWGDYDRNQLQRKCTRKSLPYPFGTTHLNVKNLYALRHRLSHEIGMDEALTREGLSLDGRHHNGRDDAYNIARLLVRELG